MDEQVIRQQLTVRFRRREIFLAHFLLWAVPGLIIGGVIMPPPHISQLLRVIFQSWAFLVAAHAGILFYLEYREYAIRREIDRAHDFKPLQKRKRAPLHDLELEDDDGWSETEELPKRKRFDD